MPEMTFGDIQLAEYPLVGITAIESYTRRSPDALRQMRVRQMVHEPQASETYGTTTYSPVGTAARLSIQAAFTDLSQFLTQAGSAQAEIMQDGLIFIPPAAYENFYRQTAQMLDDSPAPTTVIVEDSDRHSTNFLTAKVIQQSRNKDAFDVARFADLPELGDTAPARRFAFIDDWSVSGRQLTGILEGSILPHLRPVDSLDIILAVTNNNVIDDLTRRYSNLNINISRFSEAEATTDCAGFGYNGSVSWGYENIIGDIAESTHTAPPKAWHVMRPYKDKDLTPIVDDESAVARRQSMIKWIGGTLGKRERNKTPEVNETDAVRFFTGEWGGLSNFAAYRIAIWGQEFPTSEHAYQWAKFKGSSPSLAQRILEAGSAVETKKIAERHREQSDPEWDSKKLDIMREIVRVKTATYPDIQRKLLRTKEREIIEDSPNDEFWGRGVNGDGQNWMGRIWMEARQDLVDGKIPRLEEPEY